MGLHGWACLVLLAAPEVDEEGRRLLQTAYASQYEWKEDGVENATFRFSCKTTWTGADGRSSDSTHSGHVVVADGEIARIHLPGADRYARDDAAGHLAWIFARFVRPPFDERFRDVPIGAPQPLESGDGVKIRAGEEEFLVKGERLAGENRGRDGARLRCDYTVVDLRDGYAVAGEKTSWGPPDAPESITRELQLGTAGDGVPVPVAYRYHVARRGGASTAVTYAFEAPALDEEHAVVLDPAARELVMAAWALRYTLPHDVRVEASFVRKPDPKVRSGYDRMEGELRLWGMDDLQVRLDDNRFRDAEQWRASVEDRVKGDLRRMFDLLRDRPFDEAFPGCGFRRKEAGDGAWIVDVFGHPDVSGFLIEKGRFAGHRDDGAPEDAWWHYKCREKDGKQLVLRMEQTIDGDRFAQELDYARVRGLYVPRRYTFFTRAWNGQPALDEYEFRQLRATLPEPR